MITKREFYSKRSKDYVVKDREANLRYRRVLSLARTHLPRGPINVAEIGCKFAAVRDILDEMNIAHDYVGIDLDGATLAKVAPRENDRFIVADADSPVSELDDSIDLFLAMEVMEHVASPLNVLITLKGHLSARGLIVISVPNPYFWGEIIHNWRRAPDTEGHLSTLTHINIDALCRFAGLKVLASGGTFNRWPLTRRLFGQYLLTPSNSLLGARSMIYVLKPA